MNPVIRFELTNLLVVQELLSETPYQTLDRRRK